MTPTLVMDRMSYLANQLEVEFTTTNTKEPIPVDSPTRLLRSGFANARLLGFRVRIPPATWLSVPFDCCVCSQVGVLPNLVCLAEFDLETSKMKRPMSTRTVDK